MSVDPEHYHAARLALPRLPLPAILGFAVAGIGGALFLAYSGVSEDETKHVLAAANDVPVYEARAVPLDPRPESIAERAKSIARALTATQSETKRTEPSEVDRELEPSRPTLLADANDELRGFNRFANFSSSNSYLALTGATFGISAQTSPSGFVAPDAETALSSVVPEASTWLCGIALLALVGARSIHASWHRNHRREESRTKPARNS
jgi:hypothetical protein